MKIEYIDIDELKVPDWKTTHILRPDLLVLSGSLSELGFIQPIHVRASTKEIIDGSERVLLAKNVSAIKKKVGEKIPVVLHDVDLLEAMMMHLRLNRGKGSIVAKKMSTAIRKMKQSKKYAKDDFERILCMKPDELALMLDGSIIKVRKIHEHTYSRAWVPVEAPPGAFDEEPLIESPPNPDR